MRPKVGRWPAMLASAVVGMFAGLYTLKILGHKTPL